MTLDKAIQDLVKNQLGDGIIQVSVTSVDEAERTFNGTDPDGNELLDVSLQAVVGLRSGLVLFPAIGSTVLVAALGRADDDEEYVVLAFGKVDKIVIGSQVELGMGAMEPVVKGSALNSNLTQLNANLTTLNNSLAVFATAQAAAAAASPSPTLAPAFSALLVSLQSLQPLLSSWTTNLQQHLSQNVTTS